MLSFTILLNNMKSYTNTYAIRTLASRNLISTRNRKKAPKEEYEEDSPLDDIQDADYVDLSKLEQSSNETYRRVELIREREKYLIVQQKYFKINTPNFLSWNEKMKIRNLYNTNKEEWNIGKLAESFPALPDVIVKIVKSKWMKSNPNKITKHDEVMEKNWKEFRGGHLELPDDLSEHLKKFTIREHNTLHLLEDDLINITPPKVEPPPNSFEAIIANYEQIKPKIIAIAEPQKNSFKSINRDKKDLKQSNILVENEDIERKITFISTPSERGKIKKEPIFTVPGFD